MIIFNYEEIILCNFGLFIFISSKKIFDAIKFKAEFTINDAIKRGARVIVSNKVKTGINKGVLYIKVSDPRLALSSFANKYYNTEYIFPCLVNACDHKTAILIHKSISI